MNKTIISRLVIGALATIAAGGAVAGNIQSSSVAIAREVVTTSDYLWPATAVNDTRQVDSPLITYAFQGTIDTTLQVNTFQVQLQLIDPPASPSAIPTPISNGITKWVNAATALGAVQLRDATPVASGGAPLSGTQPILDTFFKLDAAVVDYSADGKTLWATFAVPVGFNIKQPTIVFAPGTNAAGIAVVPAKLTGLATIVGQVAPCDVTSKTLPVTVKSFSGVTAPAVIADGSSNGTADEHVRAASNNNGTLLTFPTNLLVANAPSVGAATIDVATANKNFAAPNDGITTISSTRLNLGKVTLSDRATGYDVNLLNAYSLNNLTATADLAATNVNGLVEARSETVVVTAPGGISAGGSVFLATVADNCAGAPAAGQVTTYNADRTVATITATGAPFLLPANKVVNVCYGVTGTAVINPSTFSANSTLVKATGTNPEQNNSCAGPLFTLGGGVKIDVRNYATPTTTSGWVSTIRVINPNETQSARVYGQLIHADGSYGNWGELTTAAAPLAARGAMNLSATVINTLLVNPPASNGAGYVAGPAGPVLNVNQAGDRLRITADGVATLRVQNYLYNTANGDFIEASASQGVDFDAITNRSPDVSQTISQDAQLGLAK